VGDYFFSYLPCSPRQLSNTASLHIHNLSQYHTTHTQLNRVEILTIHSTYSPYYATTVRYLSIQVYSRVGTRIGIQMRACMYLVIY